MCMTGSMYISICFSINTIIWSVLFNSRIITFLLQIFHSGLFEIRVLPVFQIIQFLLVIVE